MWLHHTRANTIAETTHHVHGHDAGQQAIAACGTSHLVDSVVGHTKHLLLLP